MDKYQIKNDLIKGIIDGKYTYEQVKEKIREIEARYGEEFFDNYDFPKEEKPWNRETLKKLETASLVGTCSKPFILHLAEVSECVHKEERTVEKSQKKNNRLRIVMIAILIAILLLVVIVIAAQPNDVKQQVSATQIGAQLIRAEANQIAIQNSF